MNHVYRVIYNRVLGVWQAVTELAKSSGKLGGSVKRHAAKLAALAAMAAGSGVGVSQANAQITPAANQLPQGGQVSAGQAQINQSGNVMNIDQSTQKAIINWNEFNVGKDATVNFNQPNASAATLNRVMDSNPSQIFGRIVAPGQVILINPNGAYFAPSASVDVGGLIATTHELADKDFLDGNYQFKRNGAKGKIINEGELKAKLDGYIALMAPEVRNQGVIIAERGTVALASGEHVKLDFGTGNKLQGITVTEQDFDAQIENRHAIIAEGGLVILSAKATAELRASVIKNSGQIVARAGANTLTQQGGRIILGGDTVEVSGTLDASSQTGKGGQIKVLGENIQIKGKTTTAKTTTANTTTANTTKPTPLKQTKTNPSTQITASGATGGGEILIGGNYLGKGPERNAKTVEIEKNTEITADATQKGDGGRIIVWSDESTRFEGRITARGGQDGGDGGFVETSSKKQLIVTGTVSTAAPKGRAGQWLLDPEDVEIGAQEATEEAVAEDTATETATDSATETTDSTEQASSEATSEESASEQTAAEEATADTTTEDTTASSDTTQEEEEEEAAAADASAETTTDTATGTTAETADDKSFISADSVQQALDEGTDVTVLSTGEVTGEESVQQSDSTDSTQGTLTVIANATDTEQALADVQGETAISTDSSTNTITQGTETTSPELQPSNVTLATGDSEDYTLYLNGEDLFLSQIQNDLAGRDVVIEACSVSCSVDKVGNIYIDMLSGIQSLQVRAPSSVTLNGSIQVSGNLSLSSSLILGSQNISIAAGSLDLAAPIIVADAVKAAGGAQLSIAASDPGASIRVGAEVPASTNTTSTTTTPTPTPTATVTAEPVSSPVTTEPVVTAPTSTTQTTQTPQTTTDNVVVQTATTATTEPPSTQPPSTEPPPKLVIAGKTLEYISSADLAGLTIGGVSQAGNITVAETVSSKGSLTIQTQGQVEVKATAAVIAASAVTLQGHDVTVAGEVSATGSQASNQSNITPQVQISAQETVTITETATVQTNASNTAGPNTSGRIRITGKDINTQGTISTAGQIAGEVNVSALNTVTIDGAISVDSTQSQGGRITVEAQTINVQGNAKLTATGKTGGGDILVGGDWQGGANAERRVFEDPNALRQAINVTMAQGALIDASATQNGDGGTVVLWSDVKNPEAVTTVRGTIYAKGGENSGDGGQIETSGAQLNFDEIGDVNAGSPKGTAGEWLLDPYDLEITISGGTAIANTLKSTSVTLDTTYSAGSSQNGSGQYVLQHASTGDLWLAQNAVISPTSMTSDTTLTLKAHNRVKMNPGSAIDATGGGRKLNVVFWSDQDSNSTGAIVMLSSTIKTNGGNVTFGGGSNPSSGFADDDASYREGILISNDTNNTGSIIDAGGGNISLRGKSLVGPAIWIVSTSTVKTSGSGKISLVDGGSNEGIRLSGTVDAPDIDVYTDTKLNVDSGTFRGRGGTLNLKPYTNTVAVSISNNGNYSGMDLQTDALTNRIDGFSNIVIGSTAAQTKFYDNFSVTDNLTLNGSKVLGVSAKSIITNNNNLTINDTSSTSSDAIPTLNLGSGNFYKQGAGYKVVSNFSSTGNVYISEGTLKINNSNALSDSSTVDVARYATWVMGGSDTIGSLTGLGSVTISGLTVGGGNQSSTFDGTLSGNSSLTKTGTGTFTLTGTNTYSGSTIINGGKLQLGNGGSSGSVNSTSGISNDGILIFDRSNSDTMSYAISGNGSLQKLGAGVLTLSGANTYTGSTTVSFGSLHLGGNDRLSDSTSVILDHPAATFALNNFSDSIGSLSGEGAVSLGSGSLTVGQDNINTSSVFSGVISGDGGLTKRGTGTLTLTGENTYAGTTTITQGTLRLGDGGSSGAVSSGDITNNASLTVDRNNDLTLANNISGTGQVTKDGGGSLTLSGNNSYSGTTTINNGSLIVTSNTALGTTAGDTVVNDGTLDLRSVALGNENISLIGGSLRNGSGTSSISGSIGAGLTTLVTFDVESGTQLSLSGNISSDTNGGINKTGDGILIITGNDHVYDRTTVAAGTLRVGDNGSSGELGTGAVVNDANLQIWRSNTVNLSTIVSGTAGVTGTGDFTAQIGGGFTIDRPITQNGSASNIILTAGYNVAAGTTTGGDVSFSGTGKITTSNTGAVAFFSGSASTSTLNSKVTGATGATKYKTYNASSGDLSSAVAGTRNFYYRAAPKLTVTGMTAEKVYDGNTSAMSYTSGGTITGSIDGDPTYSINHTAVDVTTALNRSTASFDNKNVGTRGLNATLTASTLTSTGWSVTGYQVNAFTGSGTITPKTVSLSATKVYDGTDNLSGKVTIVTGVGNETLSYSGATGNDTHVATTNKFIQTITLTNGLNGGLASNYQLPTLDKDHAPLTITPKTLTPTISNTGVTKTYDSTRGAPAGFTPTYTFSGLVIGDTNATLSYTSAQYNNQHVVHANTLTVSGLSIHSISGTNGSQATDYVLGATSKTVAATISPIFLDITLTNTGVTKFYDGTTNAPAGFTPTYSVVASSYLAGDSNATVSYTSAVYDNKHAGEASKLTVDLVMTGLTSTIGSLTTDYAINQLNREIAATITPKTLDPTAWTQSFSVDKVYDGNLQALTGPTYLSSPAGLVSGDTAITLGGSGTYDSKDVLTASSINYSNLVITSIVGVSKPTDYVLNTSTLAGVMGSVKPKEVALSASKIFDGLTDLTNAVTIATGITGESLSYTGASALAANVVFNGNNYIDAITLEDSTSGSTNGAASNYKLPALDATSAPVTITARPLTAAVSITGTNKVYDGYTIASGSSVEGSLLGLIGSDSLLLDVSGIELNFNSAHASLATQVIATGSVAMGALTSTGSGLKDGSGIGNEVAASSADYSLPTQPTISPALAEITPYTLSTSATITGVNKDYDGTPVAIGSSLSGNTLGALNGDVVELDLTGYSLAFNSPDVANAGSVGAVGVAAVGNVTAGGVGDKDGTAGNPVGGLPSDYQVAQPVITPVNAAILPIPLTVTANNDSKVYDGLAYSGGNGVTYTGFVNNETDAVLGGALGYNGTSQGATNAGNYTITPTGLSSSNYAISYFNGNLTVNQRPINIRANSGQGKVYGQADSALLYTPELLSTGRGLVSGDTFSGALVRIAGEDVGSYAISQGSLANANYVINFTGENYSVTPAPLIVIANDDTKTYDGLAYGGGNGVTYAGFVHNETNAVLGGALGYNGTSQGAIDAGNYLITPTGLTSSNYAISYLSGNLTVSPRPINISANSEQGKVYGEADSALLYTPEPLSTGRGLVSGDTFSGALARIAGEDVGSYAISQGSLANANYVINFTGENYTVTPAPLIVIANDHTKTYDGLAYGGGNGVTYAGFVNNDTDADLSGTVVYSGSSQGAIDAGNYLITPTGLTSSNYAISYFNGNLTVTPATLTVIANNDSKVYDGLAYGGGNGVTYAGFVNNDTDADLGGTVVYGGSSQGATNAGNYLITPAGLTSSNYAINYLSGSLSVRPASLTVIANNDSKVYDGLAYSGGNGVIYAGFVNNETSAVLGGTLDYSGSSQGATNAGNYFITPTGLTSSNYTINYLSGSLTVSPAPLTVTANDHKKTYVGLAYNGGNGVTYAGFVNNETSAVLGGTVVYGGSSQGAVDAGDYIITPLGLTSNNYTISYIDGRMKILLNPSPLLRTPACAPLSVNTSGFVLQSDNSISLKWVGTSGQGELSTLGLSLCNSNPSLG